MKTVDRVQLLGAFALALLLVLALFSAAWGGIDAHGEEYIVRGLVYETEAGIMLADEDDALYRLEGLDMAPYLERIVEVVGKLAQNELGEAVIVVTFVIPEEEMMDDGQPVPETDFNAPAQ